MELVLLFLWNTTSTFMLTKDCTISVMGLHLTLIHLYSNPYLGQEEDIQKLRAWFRGRRAADEEAGTAGLWEDDGVPSAVVVVRHDHGGEGASHLVS